MKASTAPSSSCTSTLQSDSRSIELRREYHEPARIVQADGRLSTRCEVSEADGLLPHIILIV